MKNPLLPHVVLMGCHMQVVYIRKCNLNVRKKCDYDIWIYDSTFTAHHHDVYIGCSNHFGQDSAIVVR
jgi:hypothetical protein